MKILYITAGAAGMYCGSCLRDNALASELMKQGHDVTLQPLYTPPLTDEPSVSSDKVFFGGISVYLEQHSAIFRHTPRWLDKLWDSGFALRAASKRSISVDPDSLCEMTLSILKGERGNQRKEISKLTDWLKTDPFNGAPDVIDMQNSMLIGLAKPVKEATGSPICCTLQGEDLFLDGMREPYRSQALDLIHEHSQYVDAFIAVSDYYADFMATYLKIPRGKIHVVPLGINLSEYHAKPAAPLQSPFRIGYFARVAPEKGLHLLAEAYRLLRQRQDCPPAKLEVAGYLAPEHKPYLQQIENDMREAGLAHEFHYHGSLEREAKLQFFQNVDVISVPTTYVEAKGLSVLEALASGVPVVQPRHGSFTEIVERTKGGLLFEPGDAAGLADALHSLWKNPEQANDLARQGAAGVRELYSAQRMAERALSVYSLLGFVDSPMPRQNAQSDYA